MINSYFPESNTLNSCSSVSSIIFSEIISIPEGSNIFAENVFSLNCIICTAKIPIGVSLLSKSAEIVITCAKFTLPFP